MTENYLPSQDLQKKFQKWFGDPVPADLPSPAEAHRSIGNPDPADLPFLAEVDYLSYKNKTRRRDVYDLQKLLELFSSGFSGAFYLGAGVGFIILMMNFSYEEWSIYWQDLIVVIFLAAVIGFFGGLIVGSINKRHESYSYKDEL